MSGELARYIIWAGIVAVGVGLAILDRRWIRWPLFAALLLAGIVGGIIITKISPFTFVGGDHYMEGVIVSAASALAMIGYVFAAAWQFRASPSGWIVVPNFCVTTSRHLLDYAVGDREHPRRDGQVDQPGRPEVDDKFEFCSVPAPACRRAFRP